MAELQRQISILVKDLRLGCQAMMKRLARWCAVWMRTLERVSDRRGYSCQRVTFNNGRSLLQKTGWREPRLALSVHARTSAEHADALGAVAILASMAAGGAAVEIIKIHGGQLRQAVQPEVEIRSLPLMVTRPSAS